MSRKNLTYKVGGSRLLTFSAGLIADTFVRPSCIHAPRNVAFSSSHGGLVSVLSVNLGWHCHFFGGQNEMSKCECVGSKPQSPAYSHLSALITSCKHPE